MKRLLAVLVGLALALVGTMAVAAWLSTGSASATATATTVNQANAPTATRVSGTVSLSWTASTLANGAPVGGYRVLRHHGSDAPVEVCITTSASCVDTQPLAGSVQYGVIATIGTQWRGPESDLTAFTLDDIAPVTTANISPSPNGAGWNKTAVTVTLNATDSSGVDHISYTVDAGSPVTVAGATASFPVSGAGNHTVTYHAVDGVGNVETTNTLPVKIDPSAPVTTATPTPAPTAAGWNNTNVGLAFSASDTGTSGVKSVTVDGVTTNGSTASKTVTSEGTTTVSYFATDVADNVEGTKSTTVKVDKTAPTNLTITPSSSTTTWRNSGTVTLSASDALSGIASIEYKIDGAATWMTYTGAFTVADGTHAVDFRATDAAGNMTTAPQATIKVDTALPTASISPASSSSWIKQASQSVTITGADTAGPVGGNSGVAAVVYTIDNGSPVTVNAVSATFSLGQGDHTIAYHAVDNAGNAPPSDQIATIRVDNAGPAISNLKPVSGASGTWASINCSSGDRVCADVADTVSGVNTVTFTLTATAGTNNGKCWNGSAFVASCSPQPMTLGSGTQYRSASTLTSALMGVGSYTMVVTATDVAGNSSNSTATFTVTDTTPPTIAMTYPVAGSQINNGHWGDNCPGAGVCGTATDSGSGVVGPVLYELRYTTPTPDTCWDGSNFTSAACGTYRSATGTLPVWFIAVAFNKVADGTYEIRIKATDAGGNTNRPGTTPSGAADSTFTK